MQQKLEVSPSSLSVAGKHLYIEMSSGIAGDMFLAALLDSADDPIEAEKHLLAQLQLLNLEDKVKLSTNRVKKNGIDALFTKFATPEDDWSRPHKHSPPHANVQKQEDNPAHQTPKQQKHAHNHTHKQSSSVVQEHFSHTHRTFTVIKKIISKSSLTETIKEKALSAFTLLATAEAAVHGMEIGNVHFHEVGSLDAILEVVGTCILIEHLKYTQISASPLVVGSGYVNCAHGRMPVPVPAVVKMLELEKAPFKKVTNDTGELTTPTGAALVLSLAKIVDPETGTGQEINKAEKIGIGAGFKDIKGLTNIVRCWRLSLKKKTGKAAVLWQTDTIEEITTWIDDCSGEQLSRAMEVFYSLGAVEVVFSPLTMKKSRPGICLKILCRHEKLELLGQALIEHTTTIGFRHERKTRKILLRTLRKVEVHGYRLQVKVSETTKAERVKIEDNSVRLLMKDVETGRLTLEKANKIIEKAEKLAVGQNLPFPSA